MDQSNLVAIWAAAWPYIAAIVATASTLDASLPQPRPGSHWLIVRKIISFLAINVGNASNGKQPDFVTWIVRIATPVLLAQGAGVRPVADAPAAAGPAPAPAASGGSAAAAVAISLYLVDCFCAAVT